MTTEMRPTTDWKALEDAVESIARKASVGVTPEAHASLLWVRLGAREITPLAVYEDGRRVGSMFYEVYQAGDAPVFHITGLHMDGSAEKGWFARVLEATKPIAERLGCKNRL